MNKKLVVVIYDSILNSVFHGQVVDPLIKKLNNNKYSHVYLVSFETCTIAKNIIDCLNTLHPKLSVIIIKRGKFIMPFLLFNQVRKLRKLLNTFSQYELLVRGALAGFIAARAADKIKCAHITVQARGLLGEEYSYEHRNCWRFLTFFYHWRAECYKTIEQLVYSGSLQKISYTIEAVSAAMEEYLMHTFGTSAAYLVQAQEDIPVIISAKTIINWRERVRLKLGIEQYAQVYCFSGAAKSWQEPALVINYFVDNYKKDPNSFLLVLTPDKNVFEKLLLGRVPDYAYRVVTVSYEHIYEYLAAADNGLVFREPGIMSWVSRPVKAMEYEAVGLSIVHNNTVDWLLQRYGTNRDFLG